MSRKPAPAARAGERSRLEITFDRPELLPQLFGEYDTNLVSLENRLGVYITARGARVGLEGAAEQVAAMSERLRRAARRLEPSADRLQGEAWLQFLDGKRGGHAFSQGPGRLLLDGGYRRDVAPADLAAATAVARARFLELMAGVR